MRVLIACEFSGIVRDAFRARGHDAWSCDLLPCERDSRWHIQGDVLTALALRTTCWFHGWDLVVAHPPCQRITNTGVQWLHKRSLWAELDAACDFFRAFLDCAPHFCIENPIPHKYAVERIGRSYDQLVQPYMFGHKQTKATCFWLKNLPALVPTTDLKAETMALPKRERMRLHYLPPSADRAHKRSITFTGIAAAMAEQWGAALAGAKE